MVNYLFDACSIYRAMKEKKLGLLRDAYTVDLAPYELGNSIWREAWLNRKISYEEAKKLIEIVTKLMKVMKIMFVVDYESEILDLAYEEGINFYDASYIFSAIKIQGFLVTEDEYMKRHAEKYVNVVSIDDLLGS